MSRRGRSSSSSSSFRASSGSLSSVVAVAAALIFAIPALRRPGAWDDLRWQPAMIMFVAAFAVLTAIFAITARQPADVRLLAQLPRRCCSRPSSILMAREKPADDARDLLILCLAGAGAAALLAVGGVAMLSVARATGFSADPISFPRVAIPLGFVAMGGALLVPGRSRIDLLSRSDLRDASPALLSASRGAALALAPLASCCDRRPRHPARDATRPRRLRRPRDRCGCGGRGSSAPGVTARLLIDDLEHRRCLWRHASADVATYERQIHARRRVDGVPQLHRWIGYGWANLGYCRGARRSGASRTARGPRLHVPQRRARLRRRRRRRRDRGLSRCCSRRRSLARSLRRATASGRCALYGALVLSISFFVFGLTDMTLGYDLTTTLYAFLTALLLGVRTPAQKLGRPPIRASLVALSIAVSSAFAEIEVVERAEAILELLEGADADQRRGHFLAPQHPGQRELDQRLAALVRRSPAGRRRPSAHSAPAPCG